MKRLIASSVLVVATVLATPGTASAHLHYIDVEETAVVGDGQAVVAGVVECHLGWVYAISVKLENAQGHHIRANLRGRPTCTATPQPFEIVVPGDFAEGTAAITVTAHGGTKADGILHSLTNAGTVELIAQA